MPLFAYKRKQGWTQRGCLRGALKAGDLNRATQVANGGEYERGVGGGQGDLPRFFFDVCVSENALQAILKPTFSYSITLCF